MFIFHCYWVIYWDMVGEGENMFWKIWVETYRWFICFISNNAEGKRYASVDSELTESLCTFGEEKSSLHPRSCSREPQLPSHLYRVAIGDRKMFRLPSNTAVSDDDCSFNQCSARPVSLSVIQPVRYRYLPRGWDYLPIGYPRFHVDL